MAVAMNSSSNHLRSWLPVENGLPTPDPVSSLGSPSCGLVARNADLAAGSKYSTDYGLKHLFECTYYAGSSILVLRTNDLKN